MTLRGDSFDSMEIKFPSLAKPCDWIKIPRQRQVELDEYKEFVKLGLGGLFYLNLDKVVSKDKKWLDSNSDLSDFFNYGFSFKTWQVFCQHVTIMRLNILHSIPISIFVKGRGLTKKGTSLLVSKSKTSSNDQKFKWLTFENKRFTNGIGLNQLTKTQYENLQKHFLLNVSMHQNLYRRCEQLRYRFLFHFTYFVMIH